MLRPRAPPGRSGVAESWVVIPCPPWAEGAPQGDSGGAGPGQGNGAGTVAIGAWPVRRHRLPGGQRPVGADELLAREQVGSGRGWSRPGCAFSPVGLLKGFYLHWNGFEGVNAFIDSGAALAAWLDFPGLL